MRGLFVLNSVYLVVGGLHGHYGPGGHSAVTWMVSLWLAVGSLGHLVAVKYGSTARS